MGTEIIRQGEQVFATTEGVFQNGGVQLRNGTWLPADAFSIVEPIPPHAPRVKIVNRTGLAWDTAVYVDGKLLEVTSVTWKVEGAGGFACAQFEIEQVAVDVVGTEVDA